MAGGGIGSSGGGSAADDGDGNGFGMDGGDAAQQPHDGPLPGTTIYVVDAHSVLHQVFHALIDMRGPANQPVGAIFGFARDLFYLLDTKRPDYLLCAFDLPGPTFRHALYGDYKCDRAEMPEDLRPQIDMAHTLLGLLGLPALGAPGYEADDVLATVARVACEREAHCYLVTSDKDCRQLISPWVSLYYLRRDAVYDRQALLGDWGIEPQQVVDFQALVGDATDHIPGVPLIGPKVARDLLQQHRTLEGVLAYAGTVGGTKRHANLRHFADQARLSRELARLRDDVPVAIDWQQAATTQLARGGPRPELAAWFAELGFRRFARRFASPGSVGPASPRADEADG